LGYIKITSTNIEIILYKAPLIIYSTLTVTKQDF